MDQGIDAVVPAGDGPGNGYAQFSKHVLPLALVLILLAAAVIGLLITLWPECDSCAGLPAAASPAAATQTPAATKTDQGAPPQGAGSQGGASQSGANQGAATQGGTNQGTSTRGGANQSGANQAGANQGAATQSGANQGGANQGTSNQATASQGGGASEPLQVKAVAPKSGCTTGGIPVTITGTGLGKSNPQVSFGGAAATSVVDASGSLIAIAPAHAAGTVELTIKGGNETYTMADAFTYLCAQSQNRLLLLNVLAGMLGGLLHSLRSVIWFAGNRNLRVSWLWMYYLLPLSGAIIAAIFYLVFVANLYTPSIGKGPYLIVGVAALMGMFSQQAIEKLKKIGEAVLTTVPPQTDKTPVPAPGITSITPPTGPPGGTSVVLKGTGFLSGASVMFDASAATGVQVVDTTTINAVAPPHALGKVDVQVRNPDGTVAKLANGFEYQPSTDKTPVPAPGITSITPPTGPPAGGTSVVLKGTGFLSGASVMFDASAATGVQVVDATTINAVAPPHALGKVDVQVRNPDGTVAKLANGFEYTAPAQ
jgi:large repetitive protein